MTSHFACIGIPSDTQHTFHEAMGRMFALASGGETAAGGHHLLWRDPSGAAMAFHLDPQEEIECITPFFAPEDAARWRASGGAPVRDPGCVHCSGASFDLIGGSCATRGIVQLVNFLPWLEGRRPEEVHLAVAAFASSIEFFRGGEEFLAIQRARGARALGEEPAGEGLLLSDEAFLPMGMFASPEAPMTEAATALFAGEVVLHRELRHELFGSRFHQVRVATLPGLVDVVVDEFRSGLPVVGGLALVQGWLVAQPESAC